MNFHLTPNLEKHNAKIIGKTIKTLASGHFGPILPIMVKSNFLQKNGLYQQLSTITQKTMQNE